MAGEPPVQLGGTVAGRLGQGVGQAGLDPPRAVAGDGDRCRDDAAAGDVATPAPRPARLTAVFLRLNLS
jgi:hypothetical protein